LFIQLTATKNEVWAYLLEHEHEPPLAVPQDTAVLAQIPETEKCGIAIPLNRR
jgi:hypothetical protein